MHALFHGRRPAYGLIGCGSVVFGWAFALYAALPGRAAAQHWSAVWAGLDGMEALGFAATGVLMLRRGRRLGPVAAATAALLVVDAWFDTMTAAPGTDLDLALLMAGGLELPLAGLCAAIAWRATGSEPTPDPDPSPIPAPVPKPVSNPFSAARSPEPAARLEYSQSGKAGH